MDDHDMTLTLSTNYRYGCRCEYCRGWKAKEDRKYHRREDHGPDVQEFDIILGSGPHRYEIVPGELAWAGLLSYKGHLYCSFAMAPGPRQAVEYRWMREVAA